MTIQRNYTLTLVEIIDSPEPTTPQPPPGSPTTSTPVVKQVKNHLRIAFNDEHNREGVGRVARDKEKETRKHNQTRQTRHTHHTLARTSLS
jgi:hypothetical protein